MKLFKYLLLVFILFPALLVLSFAGWLYFITNKTYTIIKHPAIEVIGDTKYHKILNGAGFEAGYYVLRSDYYINIQKVSGAPRLMEITHVVGDFHPEKQKWLKVDINERDLFQHGEGNLFAAPCDGLTGAYFELFRFSGLDNKQHCIVYMKYDGTRPAGGFDELPLTLRNKIFSENKQISPTVFLNQEKPMLFRENSVTDSKISMNGIYQVKFGNQLPLAAQTIKLHECCDEFRNTAENDVLIPLEFNDGAFVLKKHSESDDFILWHVYGFKDSLLTKKHEMTTLNLFKNPIRWIDQCRLKIERPNEVNDHEIAVINFCKKPPGILSMTNE